ncbi:glucose-6-phosphate isomerase [Mycoplasma sp. ES3157-GEN-MYC]|uniref:Glucose-6-phosphate isomerase n=1 Tax=Mycoplasma miroungigenitalium TaxID=754515 RepID=A0A6M4JBC3_9MOLU|nr:glucose-6-phosphate isomerase [Mycoplasma miroungigenitalium]MBU4690190.1 glucose-6-phosphate isomerase [Mycoplasma miroungigenitalium]MBU4691461.1 glucose-6-phosphate isomerase [Mycoplasma miroungigenitalium]QJR43296.1 glucose-6-phosphate isomerase [Mycoplasma miroungigenitalium]
MSKLTLKAFNYHPDFNNESLIEKATGIIRGIKLKTIVGFENFGFHELALNFGQFNLNEITDFAERIIKQNTKNIIIFTDSRTRDNINAAMDFVYFYDLLGANKIKYEIINCDESYTNWFDKYEFFKKTYCFENTSFVFTKLNTFTDSFVEFIKVFLNYMQLKNGYYRTLERCFIIGKQCLEDQLNFIETVEDNRLISPNILDERFSFFSEINLLLMHINGININNVLEGYTSASIDFTSEDIKNNLAFQYGYINSVLKYEKKQNILIGGNQSLNKLLLIQAKLSNENIQKHNNLTNTMCFPEDIYTYAPYTIGMNHRFFASYITFHQEKTDFRITPELNENDGIPAFKQNRLSEANKLITDGVLTTLSHIANIPLCQIILNNNSEGVLGAYVCFIYWSQIYESYLNKSNPFAV